MANVCELRGKDARAVVGAWSECAKHRHISMQAADEMVRSGLAEWVVVEVGEGKRVRRTRVRMIRVLQSFGWRKVKSRDGRGAVAVMQLVRCG